MKVSILCPIHRYGGLDVLFTGLENQNFPKSDWELILVDKLYRHRHHIVNDWAVKNDLNVIHLPPTNDSEYHIHSSVLNQALKTATGDCCIVIGDYTYVKEDFISRHYRYHLSGFCCSAPQMIYPMLFKLKTNLKQCYSVFEEPFSPEMFKILPDSKMDLKLQLPAAIIGYKYWYNRNESFPRQKALDIGGWDEEYNNSVGPSNLEFGLRMQYEAKCRIANDPQNKIYRLLSYPIPPFTHFTSSELDDSKNMKRFKELCQKYGVEE